MKTDAPKDNLFKKGSSKEVSFAKGHATGGSMHKKGKAHKMSESHKGGRK
jgi:hypothetical protein